MNQGEVIAELYTAIKKLQAENQRLSELANKQAQTITELKKDDG